MCFKFSLILPVLALFFVQMTSCTAQNNRTENDKAPIQSPSNDIQTGAQQTDEYFPLLKNQRVGLLVNQTSVVPDGQGQWISLVDTLRHAGMDVRFILTPEHGYEGKISAGSTVDDSNYQKGNSLPIYSLYGKNKKPKAEWLEQVDCIVFDVQDVGCRFYTYLSTLYYLLQACGECGKQVIVLDRPNPNDTIDGPVLIDECKSFVGILPIPLLHGCTLGELAQMMIGERWTEAPAPSLKVIKAKHWRHGDDYSLPIAPSPNLRSDHAIRLYPSLCLFEATDISIGRGTDYPFEFLGHPQMQGAFEFTPQHCQAASHPLQENQLCHGFDLRETNIGKGFHLQWLLACRAHFQSLGQGEGWIKQPKFFDRLAGNTLLRQQIMEGLSEDEIRATWQSDLQKYRTLRQKYLLYE